MDDKDDQPELDLELELEDGSDGDVLEASDEVEAEVKKPTPKKRAAPKKRESRQTKPKNVTQIQLEENDDIPQPHSRNSRQRCDVDAHHRPRQQTSGWLQRAYALSLPPYRLIRMHHATRRPSGRIAGEYPA